MVDTPDLPPELNPRLGAAPTRLRASFLTRLAGVCAALVLVVAAIGWGLVHHLQDSLGRIDVFSGLFGRPAKHSNAVNYLLVGSDTRQGLSPDELRALHAGSVESADGARSDTVILAHVSADHSRVTLISFPRDSYVWVPDYTGSDGRPHPGYQGKLNSAYGAGGPRLAVATIEQNTGVRIDHYIEVNFLSFVSVVNALGGVDVCATEPIHDPKSGLRLPAGTSRVDGARGLAFVRARYSLGDGSDLGRISRQQDFMAAMWQRATSSGTLLNPIKLDRVLSTSMRAVTTDPGLRLRDLAELASQLRGLSARNLRFVTVPLSAQDYQVSGWGSTVLWDQNASRRLFDEISLDQPVGGLTPATHAPTAAADAGGAPSPTPTLSSRGADTAHCAGS